MQELHRLHKDVPFGWVLWLQEVFGQDARKQAVRRAQASGRRTSILAYQPDDLHCLSGPH